MGDEVLVKTVSSSLQASNPSVTITGSTHTLSLAPSGPFASSESNEMLLKSDIEASFATYVTNYTTPVYSTPGTLKYASLKSISGLSTLVKKKGDPVALKSSSGTITCSLVSPAMNPTPPSGPVPDSTPTYDVDFSFNDAAQTLCTAE
jgi:hypothetical protein